jgi:hypothetical protein
MVGRFHSEQRSADSLQPEGCQLPDTRFRLQIAITRQSAFIALLSIPKVIKSYSPNNPISQPETGNGYPATKS